MSKQVSDATCKIHTNTKLDSSDCRRCDGNGWTESDLDDMDDPTIFHNSGACYVCHGTGLSHPECQICEEDFKAKEEMEESED